MIRESKCSHCGNPIFFVKRYMGEWMSLDTDLVNNGPRYSLHNLPNGGAFAAREKYIKGYRNHEITCGNPKKPQDAKKQIAMPWLDKRRL